MDKLFRASFEVEVVVSGEDVDDAYGVFQDELREILADQREFHIEPVLDQIDDEKELPSGWDGECIPYGREGNTRIKKYFGTP